jgi:hypothetical protein
MRKRYLFAILLPIVYIAVSVIFVLNSGAGHDWGTGALLILSLPLGAVSLALEYLFPKYGLITLFPLFGILQYVLVGYFLGGWLEKRRVIR